MKHRSDQKPRVVILDASRVWVTKCVSVQDNEMVSGLGNEMVDGETSQTVHYYAFQDFSNFTEIASGEASLVYTAYLTNTSKIVIKKFKSLTKEEVINEIYLTSKVNLYPNIILFYGVTKLKDKMKNYLVNLQYLNGGTLKDYLRDRTITFDRESKLKFAKEITNAIRWLHEKEIVHGDLHTIKLADFGRSCLQKSDCAYGVIPYMDPILFNNGSHLTKKSDIYSLGVLFWELTSRLSPFNFETSDDHGSIMLKILNGKRENHIRGTNEKFIALYEKCWQQEPDERPDIHQVFHVISGLKSIDSIDSENNSASNNFTSSNVVLQLKKVEPTGKLENEDFDLSNCDRDCDLSKILD
ncbi:kinase-like domain-containing protein [Glomus cerebriforme]|uniref:Kinase-like domain-containing protein n=1 Tax=Glomus cerebriforme TaxID=658196 RepID=A0A397SRP0_9GLOM|nr:kinase-like domain-containing protein [Glomus cerebriforme]